MYYLNDLIVFRVITFDLYIFNVCSNRSGLNTPLYMYKQTNKQTNKNKDKNLLAYHNKIIKHVFNTYINRPSSPLSCTTSTTTIPKTDLNTTKNNSRRLKIIYEYNTKHKFIYITYEGLEGIPYGASLGTKVRISLPLIDQIIRSGDLYG